MLRFINWLKVVVWGYFGGMLAYAIALIPLSLYGIAHSSPRGRGAYTTFFDLMRNEPYNTIALLKPEWLTPLLATLAFVTFAIIWDRKHPGKPVQIKSAVKRKPFKFGVKDFAIICVGSCLCPMFLYLVTNWAVHRL